MADSDDLLLDSIYKGLMLFIQDNVVAIVQQLAYLRSNNRVLKE